MNISQISLRAVNLSFLLCSGPDVFVIPYTDGEELELSCIMVSLKFHSKALSHSHIQSSILPPNSTDQWMLLVHVFLSCYYMAFSACLQPFTSQFLHLYDAKLSTGYCLQTVNSMLYVDSCTTEFTLITIHNCCPAYYSTSSATADTTVIIATTTTFFSTVTINFMSRQHSL